MLELPEAVTVAQQLNDTVRGRTVAYVSAAKSPHNFTWYYEDPGEYAALLTGQTVDAAHAFGGRVDLRLGDARIDFGDGVNLRFLPPGKPEPAKHQLYLAFTDGAALCCTVQMYGGIRAFPKGALDNNFYYSTAREAPSPLSAAFDEAYFSALRTDKTEHLSAKAFLATEQRIPGLGNGVLQDILWIAHLSPKRKMNTLSDAEFDALFRSVKNTLREMTDHGGRDTERDLYGVPGGYQTMMSKQNKRLICPACGGPVSREAYLGGSVYYCKNCQI